MAQQKRARKVPVCTLEVGERFWMAGILMVVVDIVKDKTTIIEFVPEKDIFGETNMMEIQNGIMFTQFYTVEVDD